MPRWFFSRPRHVPLTALDARDDDDYGTAADNHHEREHEIHENASILVGVASIVHSRVIVIRPFIDDSLSKRGTIRRRH